MSIYLDNLSKKFNHLDFTESIYTNSKEKIKTIKCKKHNIYFEAMYSTLNLSNYGCCPECKKEYLSQIRIKKNSSELEERANKYINELKNKFEHLDFSETVYKGSLEPFKIKCKKHNIYFETRLQSIRNSSKDVGCCPKCSKKHSSDIHKQKHLNKLEEKEKVILKELMKLHPHLDFSNSKYINSRTLINYNCSIHGEKSSLLHTLRNAKYGCNDCSYIAVGVTNTKSKEIELKKLIDKFPDLDFSNTKYIQTNKKFKVICSIHGVFETTYGTIIRSPKGCPKCSVISGAENNKISEEEVIQRLSLIHPHITYNNLNFTGIINPVTITCSEHGDSDVYISSFIRSPYGCPKCAKHTSTSSYEKEIYNYILSLGISENDIELNKRPKFMNGKELDIYIPKYNLAIEFNGSAYHHSSSSDYTNSFLKNTYKKETYHFDKWKLCNDNNIILLSIYDFYWILESKKEIYKAKIRHYLQLDKRIFARKCELKDIIIKEAKTFIEEHHIESYGFGYKNPKAKALYYNNELIMCITYGEHYNQSTKKFENKVHRIVTKKDITVIGGLTKLIKSIKTTITNLIYQITLSSGASSINSCNDVRYISPRYFWVNINNLSYFSRYQTQKSKLQTLFNTPVGDLTEAEYMESKGYVKVFDNGLAELSF